MIDVHELIADVKLDPVEFVGALAALGANGDLVPAAHEARKTFWKLADGVSGGQSVGPTVRSTNAMGDVFFPSQEDVFFVLARGPQLLSENQYIVLASSHEEVALRIGLITLNSAEASTRLSAFSLRVEEAVREAIDGRKSRHMKFEWKAPEEKNPLIQRLRTGESGDADDIQFVNAKLSDKTRVGSEVLTEPEARKMLIQLNQAGVAQADDLWKGRPRGHRKKVETALAELADASLLEVSQLIRCPQASDPLMQLKNDAEAKAVKNILHPACGRNYGDHDVVPAYSVSDLGRELAQGSHWMTIWVTEKLVDLGIPQNDIVWTVSSGPEEIDIAVSFLGELWIFELKDREFGVGDALPFNYRHRVRYQAEQAVVITTERVSPDAQRVLDEMAADSKGSVESRLWFSVDQQEEISTPILIEGLAEVTDQLKKSFDAAAAKAAGRRVKDIEKATGFPIAAAVEARFGAAS